MRRFNNFVIVASSVMGCWLTALLYLGSEVEYNALKQRLPWSFFQRMLVGLFIGLVAAVLLLTANLAYNATLGKATGKTNIGRTLLALVAATVLGSSIGAAIFFG